MMPAEERSFCEIPLTQGLTAVVDADLYPELSRYRWYATRGYACRDKSRRLGRGTIWMHREVLELRGQTVPVGLEVHHRNGNKAASGT